MRLRSSETLLLLIHPLYSFASVLGWTRIYRKGKNWHICAPGSDVVEDRDVAIRAIPGQIFSCHRHCSGSHVLHLLLSPAMLFLACSTMCVQGNSDERVEFQ